MAEQQQNKAEMLAEKVIQTSRNSLLLNLRFMDSAIYRLVPRAAHTTLATDGEFLFYGAGHILRRFTKEQTLIIRDILHVVLHCVFLHPFVGTSIDPDISDSIKSC